LWIKIIADIGDAIANSIGIAQIVENDWKLREDYCSNIEYKEEGGTAGGAEATAEKEKGLFG
jgi:hypothetical protein